MTLSNSLTTKAMWMRNLSNFFRASAREVSWEKVMRGYWNFSKSRESRLPWNWKRSLMWMMPEHLSISPSQKGRRVWPDFLASSIFSCGDFLESRKTIWLRGRRTSVTSSSGRRMVFWIILRSSGVRVVSGLPRARICAEVSKRMSFSGIFFHQWPKHLSETARMIHMRGARILEVRRTGLMRKLKLRTIFSSLATLTAISLRK